MSSFGGDAVTALVRLLPEIAVAVYESAPHAEARHATNDRLTGRQMRTVLYLAGSGPHTMGDIAAGLGISRAAATEMVERLVEKGVAVRDADPDDRRVVRVRLAPPARAFADRALTAWRARVVAALARHPALDADALAGFLQTLAGDESEPAAKGAA
mgnify:CR=1 FL=1